MSSDLVGCEYRDCHKALPESQMIMFEFGSETWYACPECAEKVEGHTGYCGPSCMFGHGCTEEC